MCSFICSFVWLSFCHLFINPKALNFKVRCIIFIFHRLQPKSNCQHIRKTNVFVYFNKAVNWMFLFYFETNTKQIRRTSNQDPNPSRIQIKLFFKYIRIKGETALEKYQILFTAFLNFISFHRLKFNFRILCSFGFRSLLEKPICVEFKFSLLNIHINWINNRMEIGTSHQKCFLCVH